ncbi:helix-turn-helix domain-containing protein, partial [Chryseobacterium sp. SIMBA_029]
MQDMTLADAVRIRFGAAVRATRGSRGLTQEALAGRVSDFGINMTQTMIAKLERGDRPTPISEAAVIARILDVPL